MIGTSLGDFSNPGTLEVVLGPFLLVVEDLVVITFVFVVRPNDVVSDNSAGEIGIIRSPSGALLGSGSIEDGNTVGRSGIFESSPVDFLYSGTTEEDDSVSEFGVIKLPFDRVSDLEGGIGIGLS